MISVKSNIATGCLRKLDELGLPTQGMTAWFKGWPAFFETDNIQEKCGLRIVAKAFTLVTPICFQLPVPVTGLHITALPGLTGTCKIKRKYQIQVTLCF